MDTDVTVEFFTPHPNLSDDVNRKIVQSEVEGGVFLSNLQPRTVLQILTCHHCYTAVLLRDNLMLLWGHPEICPRPVTVSIAGSTWGGTMLKTRFLGRGMFADLNLDGALDLVVANGHIDETVRNIRGNVGYAQPPQLFLNDGQGKFRDVAGEAGSEFSAPKVGRGLACGDFDRDGDIDLLVTTNNGPAYLYRNEQTSGNRGIRFTLLGTQSNRDAIGATVRIEAGGVAQTRMVRGGSSYLSQSELPVTFGLGKRDQVDRVQISWPSGRSEEFKNLAAGKAYECTETKGIKANSGF